MNRVRKKHCKTSNEALASRLGMTSSESIVVFMMLELKTRIRYSRQSGVNICVNETHQCVKTIDTIHHNTAIKSARTSSELLYLSSGHAGQAAIAMV